MRLITRFSLPLLTSFMVVRWGVSTIATAIGEDSGTVEEVYEPFLIMEGFIKRTPRGRVATQLAYDHLGRNMHMNDALQPGLFD